MRIVIIFSHNLKKKILTIVPCWDKFLILISRIPNTINFSETCDVSVFKHFYNRSLHIVPVHYFKKC